MEGYELLDEDKIPKCCGSCEFIRYRDKYEYIANRPICRKVSELVCVFGLCPKYKPSKLIFIKGV